MLAPAEHTRPASILPDGTVEGYASLFGEIDQARDMVMPGAFAASLRKRGVRRVPMLFQHDPSEPVGVWLDLHEDVHGLFARGRLIPEVVRARELLALLKAGTTDGLSIGFRTVKGRLDPKTRIRKLEAIDLWEISIVTFPLLPGARLALASKASGQREQLQEDAAPGPRVASLGSAARPRAVKQARLPSRPSFNSLPNTTALAREGTRVARTRNPTNQGWPVDRSLGPLKPERLFRKRPSFSFERDGERAERVGWRDLVMSERALRAGGRF